MPEIKNIFTGGKMNKDLDERLVKNGEYQHALNIQVKTTDGDDQGLGAAGTVQNIQGNRLIGSTYFDNWMSDEYVNGPGSYPDDSYFPRCVGSIANEKNNKAYFFFASSLDSPNWSRTTGQTSFTRKYIDTIVEQTASGETVPVVVDLFAIVDKISDVVSPAVSMANHRGENVEVGGLYQFSTEGWDGFTVSDSTSYRVGMEIRALNAQGEDVLDVSKSPLVIKAIDRDTDGPDKILLNQKQYQDIINSGAVWFAFQAERVLHFSPRNFLSSNPVRNYITGINIIDNLLFWTDNYSEPKKINIDRCKAGTNINGTINNYSRHSKLYLKHPVDGGYIDASELDYGLDQGGNQYGSGVNSDLKEEHITVIRPAPRTAPTLEINSKSRRNTSCFIPNYSFVDYQNNPSVTYGEIYSISHTAIANTDYKSGDILNIIESDDSGNDLGTPIRMKASFVCYEDEVTGERVLEVTNRMRIKIITPAVVGQVNISWNINLENPAKPLFELKLARFGYRYKYEDGEYSSFSPWSKVAFLPDSFDYHADKGYNLGMVNTIRELIVKGFVPYNRPLDIVAVDILYKTTDSPSVHVIKTIEKGKSPEWEIFTPDGFSSTDIQTGSLSVTSEMIHSTLPDNQILRAWDNVPRAALSQEIVGNRLLYANYLQGYDIKENINLNQEIDSESTAGINRPKKSLKSERDYKIGMVFGDKYGRETPVITPGYTTIDNSVEGYTSSTGDLTVPKILSSTANSFVVTQTWGDPNTSVTPPLIKDGGWIDYVKYYVKETSQEYYNLIQSRWYTSKDGSSIWLSFNSADRNKVDEDTYLNLKNQNGTNVPVTEKARYKILDIKNEAPEFVKQDTFFLGSVTGITPGHTYSSYSSDSTATFWPPSTSSSQIDDVSPSGLWLKKHITISEGKWNDGNLSKIDSNGSFSGGGAFGKVIDKDSVIQMRIVGYSHTSSLGTYNRIESSWRTLTSWNTVSTNTADTAFKIKLSWDKYWDASEVDMLTRYTELEQSGADYDDDDLRYAVEFQEKKIQNKPEFEGKFFVKINSDLTTNTNIQGFGSATFEWVNLSTHKITSIQSTPYRQNVDCEVCSNYSGASFGYPGSYAGFFDAFNNFAEYINFSSASAHRSSFNNASMAHSSSMITNGGWNEDNFSGGVGYNDMADYTCEAQVVDGQNTAMYTLINWAETTGIAWITGDIDAIAGTSWQQLGLGSNYDILEEINTYLNDPLDGWSSYGSAWSHMINLSPFGSCSNNYNSMTRDFWFSYKEWWEDQGEVTAVPFYDFCGSAFLNIQGGPDRGANSTLDPGDLPEYGGPLGGPLEFGRYAKPFTTFYKGDGMILGSRGATGGTVGSMAISWSGPTDPTAAAEMEPALYGKLRTKGTYFKFSGHPDGDAIFQTVGVLFASPDTGDAGDNWGNTGGGPSFNWRGTSGLLESWEYLNADELADDEYLAASELTIPMNYDLIPGLQCNVCDTYDPGQPGPVRRRTMWVEFRRVNPNSLEITTVGLDLQQLDPRGVVKQDGTTSTNIVIIEPRVNTIDEQDAVAELGAVWETEAKEGPELDVYYEASSAIPMSLTPKNAFDFAPINSKVGGYRFSQENRAPITFGEDRENPRVGNIHFLHPSTERAIVSIVSNVVGGDDDGNTVLHDRDLSLGDNITFEHDDGLRTTATIKQYYMPEDHDTHFTPLSTTDSEVGIVSGPKSFKIAPSTGYAFFMIANPDGGQAPIMYLNNAGGIPSVGDTVTSVTYTKVIDGTSVDVSVVFQGNSAEAPSGIQVKDTFPHPFDDNFTGVNFSLGNKWVFDAGVWQGLDENNDGTTDTQIAYIRLRHNTGYFGIDVNVWNQPIKLAWKNCWSFGNGVESDRIRDDFNAPQLDNGARVSTTYSGYGQERIGSGLIYSGLYNSTSQMNNLNEFNMAEKITKELNPSYGSIQALKTRDTDVVVFAEDKILKVMANKDALYNADGNPQLISTNKVLGQVIPFVGDYGISRNPESLAWDQFRMYFTDMQRGAVLRLSRDGLTPISNSGMRSWFKDNLRKSRFALGTYDIVSNEYNLTLTSPIEITNVQRTISYSESSKGWVSFKSFAPSSGVSFAGKYLTSNKHQIWEHHVNKTFSNQIVDRNKFYGEDPVNSRIDVVFNQEPGLVKSFKTISYEGSQARVNKFTAENASVYTGGIRYDEDGLPWQSITENLVAKDKEYYNLQEKKGWFVPLMTTDLQDGSVPEFISKEGKWYNKVSGITGSLNIVDPTEFTVQGIGQVSSVIHTISGTYDPEDECECAAGFIDSNGSEVESSTECCGPVNVEVTGCTNPEASNYNSLATLDDGSCVMHVFGCTTASDPNFNDNATIHDESYCIGNIIIGCMDPTASNYDPEANSDGVIHDGVFYPYENYSCLFGPISTCPEGTVENHLGDCIFIDSACFDDDGVVIDCETNTDGTCPEGMVWQGADGVEECVPIVYGCMDILASNYAGPLDMYQWPANIDNINGMIIDPPANTPCFHTSMEMSYVDASGNVLALSNEAHGSSSGISVTTQNSCCVYPPPHEVDGCMDVTACNYNPFATFQGGEIPCTYDCYGCMAYGMVNFNPNATIACTDDFGVVNGTGGGCCIEELCGCGCMNPLAGNYCECCSCSDPDNPCVFWEGDTCATADVPNANCYGCMDDGYQAWSPYPGTAADNFSSTAYWNYTSANDPTNPCYYRQTQEGCTDETAANYCPTCTDDDGSCVDVIVGCMDNSMGNYDPQANMPCEGCCEEIVYGCTNPESPNYNPLANTIEPHLPCTDWVYGCMDGMASNFVPMANTSGMTQPVWNYETNQFDHDPNPCNSCYCFYDTGIILQVENYAGDSLASTSYADNEWLYLEDNAPCIGNNCP